MSIWDWVIILVVAMQFILLISLAMALLKIKNGPVAAMIRRVKSLTLKGKALATTGQNIYERNRPHIERMVAELADTGKTLQQSTADYQAVTAGPKEVLAQWAKLQMGLGILKQGQSLLQRRAHKIETVPAGGKKVVAPRRSLAHRMGLVPPIVQRVERFFPYIGYANQFLRALKQNKVF